MEINKFFVKNLTNKYPAKDITEDDIKFKLKKICNKKKRVIKINSKVSFGKKTLPIIAGPNGVESRSSFSKVVNFLKKNKVNCIRGHAFKPLTFPYRSKMYDDTGVRGLEWIKEIKNKNKDLVFVSEITEIQYLDKMIDVIDILQIGSRNMQNLELLREVANTNKPIILKRHFGASLRDWFGAAEHILVEGNEKLILCERGVSVPHTHKVTSRFMLDVQAIVAANDLTTFPIISDPSHACFWASWVDKLSYASVASGCDGLIIETHPNPKKSKVDPLQPLNFKQFSQLLKKIKKLGKFFNKKVI